MAKLRTKKLIWLAVTGVAVAMGIVLAAAYYLRANPSASLDPVCLAHNIPERSCGRAKQSGYYCPSWDAKPGEVSSMICIGIK